MRKPFYLEIMYYASNYSSVVQAKKRWDKSQEQNVNIDYYLI